MGTLSFGANTGNSGGRPAQHVTIDGIRIDGQVWTWYADGVRPSYITLKNLHMGQPNNQALAAGSVFHFTLDNVVIGPECCNDDGAQIAEADSGDPQSSYVTLNHVTIHDIAISCANIPRGRYPDCASDSKPFTGNHVDCLQMLGGDHITITDSELVNCDGGTFTNGIGKGARYWDILVENTMLQGHNIDLTCGGPCEGGSYAVLARDPTDGSRSYVRFYYDTLPDGTYFSDWQPGGNYEFVGNIDGSVPPSWGSCTIAGTGGHARARFSVSQFNMFTSGAKSCGPTNFIGNARYVNGAQRSAGINLHLKPGSPGLGRGSTTLHPARDVDGRLRPVRFPPDVGADQLESAAIVLGRRIGGVSLGMSKASVEAFYGPPRSVASRRVKNGTRTSVTVATYTRHHGKLWVAYNTGGGVVGVATSSRYYTTASGFGPGAPLPRSLRRSPWARCAGRYRRHSADATTDVTALRGNVGRLSITRNTVAAACKG